MNIDFLELAAQEFYEAIAFYNIQRSGLGQDYAKEVESSIERIKQNPEAWTVVSSSKQARRCLPADFPTALSTKSGKTYF